VNRNLIVNLGLRYEYYPLINRGDRGIERWDPATNIVYFGGLGGTPNNAGITVSNKLLAPRVGLAYRFGESLVVRAGYGITYDSIPYGRPLRGLYPATLTGTWQSPVTNFGWYNTLDLGIPDIPTPDVSKGQAQLPLNIDMGPRSPWAGELHRGYIQSWNLTIERKLPYDMVGKVAYVATRTIHQMIDRNINTAGPGLGASRNNVPLAKLYGRTIDMSMWDGIGYGAYDSLQTNLNRSFSGGLMVQGSYTFGKALNMTDENGWASLRGFNWEPMLKRNYSPAGYDRRHMLAVGWVYELPFGRSKKFNLTGLADHVLGGWSMNGMFSAYSGTPFTVTGSSSSLQCIGCTQTADLIAPVKKLGNFGPQAPYYDVMSFQDPLVTYNQTKVYRPGTMGLDALYGPGFWQFNPAVYKKFKVTERVNAEFRAESTNALHASRWGNPSGTSANLKVNPDGSLNTTVANPYNNFMAITSNDNVRQFRFGLRLAF
jgi:hypothetical protein